MKMKNSIATISVVLTGATHLRTTLSSFPSDHSPAFDAEFDQWATESFERWDSQVEAHFPPIGSSGGRDTTFDQWLDPDLSNFEVSPRNPDVGARLEDASRLSSQSNNAHRPHGMGLERAFDPNKRAFNRQRSQDSKRRQLMANPQEVRHIHYVQHLDNSHVGRYVENDSEHEIVGKIAQGTFHTREPASVLNARGPSNPDSSGKVNTLILEGDNSNIYAWISRLSISTTDCKGFKYPLLDRATKGNARKVRWLLELLVHRVYAINHHFLKQFKSKQSTALRDEQTSLQEWLLQETWLPHENLLCDSLAPPGQPSSAATPLSTLQNLFYKYLYCRSFLPNKTLRFLKPKQGKDLDVTDLEVFGTELAVNIIGSYFKTINPAKWASLFTQDEQFLLALANIKRASFHSNNLYSMFKNQKSFKGIKVIPWKDRWDISPEEVVSRRQNFCTFYPRALVAFIDERVSDSPRELLK